MIVQGKPSKENKNKKNPKPQTYGNETVNPNLLERKKKLNYCSWYDTACCVKSLPKFPFYPNIRHVQLFTSCYDNVDKSHDNFRKIIPKKMIGL